MWLSVSATVADRRASSVPHYLNYNLDTISPWTLGTNGHRDQFSLQENELKRKHKFQEKNLIVPKRVLL